MSYGREMSLIEKLDYALAGMLSGWDEPELYDAYGVEDDLAASYFDEAFDQVHDPNINPRHRLSMGGWSDRDIDELAEALGGEQELNEALEKRYRQRVAKAAPKELFKKGLKKGLKKGVLKAIPVVGLAAEFADIPTAEAATMPDEARTITPWEEVPEPNPEFELPTEEPDYSPGGVRKSRNAAAKKAMEK